MLPKWNLDATKSAIRVLRNTATLSREFLVRRRATAISAAASPRSTSSESAWAKRDDRESDQGGWQASSVETPDLRSADRNASPSVAQTRGTVRGATSESLRSADLRIQERHRAQNLNAPPAGGRPRLFEAQSSTQSIAEGDVSPATRASGGIGVHSAPRVLSVKVGPRNGPNRPEPTETIYREPAPPTRRGNQAETQDFGTIPPGRPRQIAMSASPAKTAGSTDLNSSASRAAQQQSNTQKISAPVPNRRVLPPEQGLGFDQTTPDGLDNRSGFGLASGLAAQQQNERSAQSDTRPAEGDVYLDGTLVGRWMEKHLARAASRQPAGSSAFDATRSRLPTGTMIGV